MPSVLVLPVLFLARINLCVVGLGFLYFFWVVVSVVVQCIASKDSSPK